jgi:hypothetical protein
VTDILRYTTLDGRTVEVKVRYAGTKGYAAQPGTGPEGETCGSCKNHKVTHGSEGRSRRNYHKCGLMAWTYGPGTDIRVRSPACSKWVVRRD